MGGKRAVWVRAPVLGMLVLLGAACSTPKEPLLQVRHRVNYALQDHELKGAQYFISQEVKAMSEAPELVGTPEGVVIVPLGTAGAATEVGPNWIRVSFSAGGRGVPFVAVDSKTDSAYWIATEIEGESGFHALRHAKTNIIRVDGIDYRIVYGTNARLLISSKDLEKLIEERPHLKGRTPGSN